MSEIVDRILSLRADGLNQIEIAERLGIGVKFVRDLLKRNGTPWSERPQCISRDKVIALRDAGLSRPQAAACVGLNRRTFYDLTVRYCVGDWKNEFAALRKATLIRRKLMQFSSEERCLYRALRRKQGGNRMPFVQALAQLERERMNRIGSSDAAHETGGVCRNEDASSDAQYV